MYHLSLGRRELSFIRSHLQFLLCYAVFKCTSILRFLPRWIRYNFRAHHIYLCLVLTFDSFPTTMQANLNRVVTSADQLGYKNEQVDCRLGAWTCCSTHTYPCCRLKNAGLCWRAWFESMWSARSPSRAWMSATYVRSLCFLSVRVVIALSSHIVINLFLINC